jgi:two-component system, LytTR family, sensor kinase
MYLPLQTMKQKLTPIMAHIAGWILFLSLVIGFVTRSPAGGSILANFLSSSFIVFCLVYIFLFYFNTYFLIPRLYLQKQYVLYGLFILLLLVAVYFIRPFDGLMNDFSGRGKAPMELRDPGGAGPRHDMQATRPDGPPGERVGPPPPSQERQQKRQQTDIVSIILFITVWSLSTAICIIRQWRLTEQRAVQAEADKANAELTFLKAQINPHFLFNTLNNIYSLAITKNEHTAASIMKLSNIMRYVTDDIRENFVLLNNEIECMGDYIDLQKLRLGKKMNVDFSVSGEPGTRKIAPLILMTFIENVFKYGISNHEPSDISIRLTIEQHSITFFCQNKIYDTKRNVDRPGTGIGIENTRQRLQHLYPNKHFLDIKKDNGLFTVQLTLQG